MTVSDDYLEYLYAKQKEALDIQEGYRSKPKGELDSSAMIRQWGEEAMKIQAKIQKSRDHPDDFAEEADIWRRRNAFPLH